MPLPPHLPWAPVVDPTGACDRGVCVFWEGKGSGRAAMGAGHGEGELNFCESLGFGPLESPWTFGVALDLPGTWRDRSGNPS